jgi:Tol biopolymer transport system component
MTFIRFCLTFVILIILMAGCFPSIQPENPSWLDELIKKYQSEPVGNPPQSVWRYDYNGQMVYYIPPQCCDQYSALLDENGKFICAPDGGFTGKGDSRCPDFIENRTNEELIWEDSRTR